jgi:hypothetical protein
VFVPWNAIAAELRPAASVRRMVQTDAAMPEMTPLFVA